MMGFFSDALSQRTLLLFPARGSKQCVEMGADLLVCVSPATREKQKTKTWCYLTPHSIAISACSCWLDTAREKVSVCLFSRRRKVEIMHTHSLFTLLGERLMLHTSTVSVTTYNTLYEVMHASRHLVLHPVFKNIYIYDDLIYCDLNNQSLLFQFLIWIWILFQILTEQVCTQVVHKPHPEPESSVKIQNPSKRHPHSSQFGPNQTLKKKKKISLYRFWRNTGS